MASARLSLWRAAERIEAERAISNLCKFLFLHIAISKRVCYNMFQQGIVVRYKSIGNRRTPGSCNCRGFFFPDFLSLDWLLPFPVQPLADNVCCHTCQDSQKYGGEIIHRKHLLSVTCLGMVTIYNISYYTSSFNTCSNKYSCKNCRKMKTESGTKIILKKQCL